MSCESLKFVRGWIKYDIDKKKYYESDDEEDNGDLDDEASLLYENFANSEKEKEASGKSY